MIGVMSLSQPSGAGGEGRGQQLLQGSFLSTLSIIPCASFISSFSAVLVLTRRYRHCPAPPRPRRVGIKTSHKQNTHHPHHLFTLLTSISTPQHSIPFLLLSSSCSCWLLFSIPLLPYSSCPELYLIAPRPSPPAPEGWDRRHQVQRNTQLHKLHTVSVLSTSSSSSLSPFLHPIPCPHPSVPWWLS